MKNVRSLPKCTALKHCWVTAFLFISILLLLITNNRAMAGGRFEAPDFNTPLEDFNKRIDSEGLNVDYIVAASFNRARKIERETTEFINKNTAFFTNLANTESTNGNNNAITTPFNNASTNNSAISNSIIIPPGTKADTIIIINENQGDSFAIQR